MEKKKYLYNAGVEVFILPHRSNSSVLLLKRAENRKILAGFFAGVGGKIDSSANESPLQAAFRELKEETGIRRSDMASLELRAVTACSDRLGRWLLFEFVGKARKKISLEETREGRLAWIPLRRLPRIRLAPDLKNGILKKIIKTKKLLWLQTRFDRRDLLLTRSSAKIKPEFCNRMAKSARLPVRQAGSAAYGGVNPASTKKVRSGPSGGFR